MAKKLTLMIMDPPYESANTTTAFRLIDACLRKGHSVDVFAYEGAVGLTFKDQKPHPNPVHGTTVEEEKHPVTKDLVAGLFSTAKGEAKLMWINCGLCVDERGMGNWIEGPVRGGPAELVKSVGTSDNVLAMTTVR